MTFPPRSPGAARALGMLVLIVAFAAGAVAAFAFNRVLHAEPGAGDAAASEECEKPRRRLLDQVDLTEEQRARIDAIVERRREQTDRFWSEAGPELRSIMDATRAEIRAVLTPEQREAYDRLRRERKAAKAARDAAKGTESVR